MPKKLVSLGTTWSSQGVHQLLENNLSNLNFATDGALANVTQETLDISRGLFYYLDTGDFESMSQQTGINFDLVSDQQIQQIIIALFAVGSYGRTTSIYARQWCHALKPVFALLDQTKLPLLGVPEDDDCFEDLLRYQLTTNVKDFIRYTNFQKKPKVSWHYNSEFAHYSWTPQDIIIATRHLKRLDRRFDVRDWLFEDGPTLLASPEVRFFLANQNLYLNHKKRFETRYGPFLPSS
jgi:hypothetical protein